MPNAGNNQRRFDPNAFAFSWVAKIITNPKVSWRDLCQNSRPFVLVYKKTA